MTKKQKRSREIALHLAMDMSRSRAGVRAEDVVRDAKRLAKFLAKS